MASLKSDVTTLKSDVETLKSNVAMLKISSDKTLNQLSLIETDIGISLKKHADHERMIERINKKLAQ